MNVVVQAYLIFAAFNAFLRHDGLAGTGLVEFAAKVEQGVHSRYVAVRTEISSAARTPPCLENARQVFVCNRNGRVGLVVFEQYVVARFVAFNQIVFEQQRVFFGFYHYIFNVSNLRNKHACLS